MTNTGNAPISDVVLTDDAGTPDDTGDDFDPTFTGGDTDGDGLLDVDETWLYEATGTAEPGLYGNFAIVTGLSATEVELRDNDPSHYFGVVSGVTIKKYTNGEDADDPTGPVLKVGSEVRWTYVVTNTGNFPIAGWTVTDDINGTVGCPRIVLLPDRPVTCFDNGTAEEGQYANVGTVDATDVLGRAAHRQRSLPLPRGHTRHRPGQVHQRRRCQRAHRSASSPSVATSSGPTR